MTGLYKLTCRIILSDNLNKYSGSELSKRLIKEYMLPHKRRILISFACMIVAAAATAFNALMIEPVLDKIFVEKDEDLLMWIPLAVLCIAFVKAAAVYGYAFRMKFVGQRIVTDMQIQLYDHLLYSDIEMFSDKSSGNLISRFTNDIHIIRKDVAHVLTGLVNQLFTLVFLVAVLLYQSVDMAMIGIVVFIFAIYPIVRLGKKMRKVSHNIQENLEDFTQHLEDSFQAVRVVKAYNNEEYEVKKASGTIEKIFNLYVKSAKIESVSSPMMEMLAGFAIAGVIWYGGFQVIEGNTTPGSFFSFIAALLMAYKPMKGLASLNTSVQEGLSAVSRLFIVLDEKPKITDKNSAEPLDIKNANVVFEKVHFTYNGGKAALNGLDLKIPAGKNIALVGNSGGGKSTIMNMILRFYDPTQGSITVNNQDLRNIQLKSLRSNIAVVNQEATLFNDTISANISYAKQNATQDEIINAAKKANAHEFITEQKNGYDTKIGQHGLKLSGGQRQRIAIARAMLADSAILLLDEATSALDNVSEKKVQDALRILMKGRTTLVIAHRLSTIVNCDLIYVIDDGIVVESGTHDELMELQQKYAELYEHQFR